MTSFNFIDLFAGIGGFHFSLAEYGGECVWASEIDKKTDGLYSLNHGIVPAGDITTVNELNIPAHDVITAGFPCQPFSKSGA